MNFPGLIVPVSSIKECKKVLRDHLPNLRMKLVVEAPVEEDKSKKMILLHPNAKVNLLNTSKLKALGVESQFFYKELMIG